MVIINHRGATVTRILLTFKNRNMKNFLKFALAVYLLGLIIGIIESI